MRAVPLNRYLVFLLIAGGGFAADLATKRWMFDWLGMPGGQDRIGSGPMFSAFKPA